MRPFWRLSSCASATWGGSDGDSRYTEVDVEPMKIDFPIQYYNGWKVVEAEIVDIADWMPGSFARSSPITRGNK
jgi:protein involved in sex pheromone biosynthesis